MSWRAGISRPTLYECWGVKIYPSLATLGGLAIALEVHPLRLLELFYADRGHESGSHRPRQAGDRSTFVCDLNYPDGSWVVAGSTFRKGWTLQNDGTVPWEGRCLTCQDEEVVVFSRQGEELVLAPCLSPAERSIPIPRTEPGETVNLEVEFTAPNDPATVLSYWKMTRADGTLCFPGMRGVWVKVVVVAPAMYAECTDQPRESDG